MHKLVGIVMLSLLCVGCSGKVRLGYMLDAEGQAHWQNEQESANVD